MKTPREILFARHRAAEPKLDAIRQSFVAVVGNRPVPTTGNCERRSRTATPIWLTLWRELIQPSRRLWTGLAATWVVILAINFTMRDASPVGRISATPVMMSVGEQQRWLNQLFADRLPAAEAEPPKTFSPKPRTEIIDFIAV